MKIKNSIVFGIGELAVNCAALLKRKGLFVTLVQLESIGFRFVDERCKKLRIDCRQLTMDTIEYMHNLPPYTLLVSAGNTYIFDKETLRRPGIIAINYHNALLPMHRGMNAEAWSIYEQETITGVTWHVIDTKIDTGKIIKQEKMEILPNETSLQLMKRQQKLAYLIFEAQIDNILSGNMDLYDQTGVSSYHKTNDIPNKGFISDMWEFNKTYAFLRSMDYGPLYMLGRPKVNIHGEIYTWDKYVITPCVDNSEKIEFVNDKIILNYSCASITLMNSKIHRF